MATPSERIKPVEVRDPRTVLTQQRTQAILKSGSQITYATVTAQSPSLSGITFNWYPPSGGVIVDRKVYVSLPVRLVIAGTVNNGAANGTTLLQSGRDALRAFPLSGSVQTLNVTINNQSVSTQLGSVVHPLQHYNVDTKLKNSDYSMTPTYYDASTSYASVADMSCNSLGLFGDSRENTTDGRGAFPMQIVKNTAGNAGDPVTAIVEFVITEPLFLSPFYFGQKNSSGFFNVSTLQINLSMLNDFAYRMWSHMNGGNGNANYTTITSITPLLSNFQSASNPQIPFTFPSATAQPRALFTYITPHETMKLSPFESLSYPFFQINDLTTTGIDTAAGAYWSATSNNVQLNSIPRRLYIFARPEDTVLLSAAGCQLPDCYFSLENISIQFNNTTGILSSATKEQLFLISSKNGCDMNWTEWSGGGTNAVAQFGVQANAVANNYPSIKTVGSVLCLEFGSDIGLPITDAAGKVGQYNLQLTVQCTNNFSVDITPTLHIVVVSEGTFTIEKLGQASVHIGDLTTNDILEAQPLEGYDYYDIQDVNGGNFFSGLKKFGKSLLSGIRGVVGVAPSVMKTVNDVAPLFRSAMGAGYDGGAVAHHSDLRNRLRNY